MKVIKNLLKLNIKTIPIKLLIIVLLIIIGVKYPKTVEEIGGYFYVKSININGKIEVINHNKNTVLISNSESKDSFLLDLNFDRSFFIDKIKENDTIIKHNDVVKVKVIRNDTIFEYYLRILPWD